MSLQTLTMEDQGHYHCNLELRLSPSPSPSPSPCSSDSSDHRHQPRLHQFIPEESTRTTQQLTIFYNGRVSVGEFTEDQARAIITLATKQSEEQKSRPKSAEPSSPEQCNPVSGSGLSMKRSLQRFLQKRTHRIKAASPYNH